MFADRVDAGAQLADQLERFRSRDAIVLALPRGGVVVGRVIAERLDLALDVIVTRKIGAPIEPEYAIGAVAENGIAAVNAEEVRRLGIEQDYLDREIAREREEIRRRVATFRDGRPMPSLRDRTVIVVDDGIATGFTVRVALQAIRAEQPAWLVLAVPVAPRDVVQQLGAYADEVVAVRTPTPFVAVGAWYDRFDQLTDADVRQELATAHRHT